MIISRVPVAKINPAAYNPRKDLKPGDPEYERLLRSIERWDLVEPLVWNERSGNLVGGHQRLKILQARGDAEVDVSVVDLDANDEAALNVALNKIGGEWDIPKLADLLSELDANGFDATLTGFDIAELEGLLAPKSDGHGDPDAVPDVPETPKSRLGEVYELGRHRLMCGDSTDGGSVAALLAGNVPVLMVTDPPYGVDYGSIVKSRENQKAGGWKDITNDALTDEELGVLLDGALSGGGAPVAFVWHPAGARRFLFWRALEKNGYRIAQEIVWVKNAMVFGRADYQWRHEPCLYAKRPGAAKQEDRTQTTVWEVAKPTGGDHPTGKPVELYRIPFGNHSGRGDGVYDPFAGSGTAVIAAEEMGRICYMMEIDPGYCDVIRKRYADFVGRPEYAP